MKYAKFIALCIVAGIAATVLAETLQFIAFTISLAQGGGAN